MEVNSINSIQNFAGKKQREISLHVDLNNFVNANDEDLYLYAKDIHKQKHKNDTAKFLGACIGVDALSNMILTSQVVKHTDKEVKILKAPLSAKIGAGLKSIKGWAVGIAGVTVLMGAKNILTNTNKKFKEFEEKYPIMSLFADIGILVLGYKGAGALSKKIGLSDKLTKKTLPLTNKIKNIADKIDKSKISTFIMNRSSEIANKINSKAPALGKTFKLLLSNSVLIMLIAGMFKLNKNNNDFQKEFENLKNVQNQLKENIV